jgi:hypothetical protein
MPRQDPPRPGVRVTLLGRFAVSVGGVPVAEAGWKRRHAAAVVKVLALAPGRRLHRALPLARDSMVAKHLLHRVFGAMISAAAGPREARQVVERSESMLGWDDFCRFCSIMRAVPAAITCARDGDLPAARRYLATAERSAAVWRDTSWEAGLAEAHAAVAAASGDAAGARERLLWAADRFQRAGQPLDAVRCRAGLGAIPEPAAAPARCPRPATAGHCRGATVKDAANRAFR